MQKSFKKAKKKYFMNTDEKNKIKLVLPVETIPGIGGGG
jgi:hypothetical protein